MTVEKNWADWLSTHSKRSKDALLAEYAGLVRVTAQRLAVGLPPQVEIGDLVGAGAFGLMRALDAFDPSRGIRFETYAAWRIRGAILDELRALDWVPRAVRAKSRKLQRTYGELAARLGRQPFDEEVAEEMGISIPEFEELLTEIAPTTLLSLDELGFDDEEGSHQGSWDVADPQAGEAFERLENEETVRILREAVARLPEKERLVIALYHHEELTFREIGQVLGLTESRVCQIHSKAVARLRGRVASMAGVRP